MRWRASAVFIVRIPLYLSVACWYMVVYRIYLPIFYVCSLSTKSHGDYSRVHVFQMDCLSKKTLGLYERVDVFQMNLSFSKTVATPLPFAHVLPARAGPPPDLV